MNGILQVSDRSNDRQLFQAHSNETVFDVPFDAILSEENFRPRADSHAADEKPLDGNYVSSADQPLSDKHPFMHAIGRHRAGRSRARLDAIDLKTASNYDFVERINEDCRVGPHLEWIVAGVGGLAKAGAAGYIGARVGAHGGTWGTIGGIAGGGIKGLIGGAFVGYESAEFLENSCKASAYEKRLLQNPKAPSTDDGDSPGLPIPDALQFNVEPDIPSVRDSVDWGKEKLRELYTSTPPLDHNFAVFQKAIGQDNLDNASFVEWAKKESYWTLPEKTAHYGVFSGLGVAGGWYIGHEMGLTNRYALGAKVLGAGVGAFLSWMRIGAHENTSLAELYSARLLDRPDDKP